MTRSSCRTTPALLRRLPVLVVALLVVSAAPALGKQTVKPADKRRALDVVSTAYGSCLSVVGKSTAGAKVTPTTAKKTGRPADTPRSKPFLVTLTTSETFVVHLKDRTVTPLSDYAKATITLAGASGRKCG